MIAPQGGYIALKATDPELLKIGSKVFNVDIGEDEYDEISDICRTRMQNAFELAELFAGIMAQQQQAMTAQMGGMQPQMPVNDSQPQGSQPPAFPLTGEANSNNIDPVANTAVPQPYNSPDNRYYDLIFTSLDVPIRPAEKNHSLKAKWFQDFLDTQEGLRLNPSQRDICFEFIWQHRNADLTAQGAAAAAGSMMGVAANGPAQLITAKASQMIDSGDPANENDRLAKKPAK
jgi:hypothetical protein